MWEACESCEEVADEGDEERLCLWREVRSVVGMRCPFVEAREATELVMVAGPEAVGWSGVVSATSCRRGCRSGGPWVVCDLFAADGLVDPRCPVDFVVCSLGGRVTRAVLKHSVPHVSEYP